MTDEVGDDGVARRRVVLDHEEVGAAVRSNDGHGRTSSSTGASVRLGVSGPEASSSPIGSPVPPGRPEVAGSSSAMGAAGRLIVIAMPAELARPGLHLSVHRLDEAARDGQPDAEAERRPGPRSAPVEAIEEVVELAGGHPRTAVLEDELHHAVGTPTRGQSHGRWRRRMERRVLHDVSQGLVEQDAVDHDRRQLVGDEDDDLALAERSSEPVDRRLDQLSERVDLEVREERPRLDPADVEELPDEPPQPLGLAVDRPGHLAPLAVRELQVRVHQAAGDRPDPRERRPEVVRDRVEEGGLQRVALAGDLGVGRLAPKLLAAQGEPELVGGERQEPGRGAVRAAGRARAQAPDRTQRMGIRLDEDAVGVEGPGGACRSGLAGPRFVDLDPVGGRVSGSSSEDPRHGCLEGGAARAGRAGVAGATRIGQDPGLAGAAYRDPDALETGLVPRSVTISPAASAIEAPAASE